VCNSEIGKRYEKGIYKGKCYNHILAFSGYLQNKPGEAVYLNMNKKVASCFFGLILITNLSNSQVLIESLKDGSLPSNLEIIGSGASQVAFTSSGVSFNGTCHVEYNAGRAYLRTKSSNLLNQSFIAEVTMNFGKNKDEYGQLIQHIALFGIGGSGVNTTSYNEPLDPTMKIMPHTYLPSHPDWDGRIGMRDVAEDGSGTPWSIWAGNNQEGIYRLRLTYEQNIRSVLFEVDWNYDGQNFTSDSSIYMDASDNIQNSTNFLSSKLFFGGSDGVTFSDLSLVPEPSALSLLAVGLGGLAMMRRRRS